MPTYWKAGSWNKLEKFLLFGHSQNNVDNIFNFGYFVFFHFADLKLIFTDQMIHSIHITRHCYVHCIPLYWQLKEVLQLVYISFVLVSQTLCLGCCAFPIVISPLVFVIVFFLVRASITSYLWFHVVHIYQCLSHCHFLFFLDIFLIRSSVSCRGTFALPWCPFSPSRPPWLSPSPSSTGTTQRPCNTAGLKIYWSLTQRPCNFAT